MNGDRCFYCESKFGLPVHGSPTPLRKTRDHIIPRSKNGNSSELNLVPCCQHCNTLKGSLLPENFTLLLEYRIKAAELKIGNKSHIFPVSRYIKVLNNNNILIEKISPYREKLLQSYKYRPVSKNKPTVSQREKIKKKLLSLPAQPDLLHFSVLYEKEEQKNFHYE